MYMQSAAAALRRGHYHLASVLLQNAYRRCVQPRERHVRNAARQKRHAIAPRSFGGKCSADLREKEGRLGRRRKTLQPTEFSKQAQEAGGSNHTLQTAYLIQVEQRAGRFHQTRTLQEMA